MSDSRYKDICVHDAIRAFRQIKTLCVKPKSKREFFVEPIAEQGYLRLCSVFKQLESGATINGTSLEVYFHLYGTEDLHQQEALLDGENEYHLYGAAGQVNVLQMRLFGKITLIDDLKQRNIIINDILLRLLGSGEDPLDKALEFGSFSAFCDRLKEGNFYRFEPFSFAYASYQRG